MGVSGSLQDMALTTLISVNCTEGNRAQLQLRRGLEEALIYFDEGEIIHVALGDREGEEAIYELLTWEDGEFELEMDVPPPVRTVNDPWSNLLLEGMQRIDEGAAEWEELDELGSIEREFESVEESTMTERRKADRLAEILQKSLSASADIESGAIIGTDGMVLSAIVTGKLSEDVLGAQAAAFYGIAKRASTQMERGTPYQAVIQSDNGNIVVTAIDAHTVFVGTTPKDATLGMVFREAREIAESIGVIL